MHYRTGIFSSCGKPYIAAFHSTASLPQTDRSGTGQGPRARTQGSAQLHWPSQSAHCRPQHHQALGVSHRPPAELSSQSSCPSDPGNLHSSLGPARALRATVIVGSEATVKKHSVAQATLAAAEVAVETICLPQPL